MARRFAAGSVAAIGVLVITGALMASHYDKWDEVELWVKLGLVAAVGLLVGWHARRPELHALEGAIFVASLAIVWLGIVLAH